MHKRDLSLGSQTLSIETGRLAKQADGSVVVRMGDTMVLVTACHSSSPREGIDFLPQQRERLRIVSGHRRDIRDLRVHPTDRAC